MKKLLIVDDEPDIRRTLSLLFASGFEVFEAGDGPEAIRAARAHPPDLVLLDITMPGMSGLAALRALKRDRPDVIVIMLTAEQDIRMAKRALDHGAAMYVTKPYDPRYMRAEVERLLTAGAAHEAAPDDRPWRIA